MSLTYMQNRISSIDSILAQFKAQNLPEGLRERQLKFRRRKRYNRNEVRGWRKPSPKTIRSHHRIVFEGSALVTIGDHDIMANVSDISMSGIFLELRHDKIKVDEEVAITIIPPNGKRTFQTQAKLVRHAHYPEAKQGIAFTFIRD